MKVSIHSKALLNFQSRLSLVYCFIYIFNSLESPQLPEKSVSVFELTLAFFNISNLGAYSRDALFCS